MSNSRRMSPHLIGAAVAALVTIAVGAPRISLLPLMLVIVCPLMMFMMMRGMTDKGTPEDHTGHGCEHDPTPHIPDIRQPSTVTGGSECVATASIDTATSSACAASKAKSAACSTDRVR